MLLIPALITGLLFRFPTWLLIPVVIDVIGFVLTFMIQRESPVTPALGLLRSVLWPLYWFTPLLNGVRLPMD